MSTHFQMAQSLGMTEAEWDALKNSLQRLPSVEELQMISVMWSEHCSYKSSKPLLKKIKTESSAVLEGPGENAGLVKWGEKQALAFKVESHNHPSLVEPFQGAATGVGGILRDIFTMGARPVAVGNYLRFGDLRSVKHQRLLSGVVSGISHYGNCMGIPNLGGQIHTDSRYDNNILVNVFALGAVDIEKIYRANSGRAGASVMLWGARTGRDGVHGASLLASADFDERAQDSLEQKIRVQVGDPFKEKCLMEACLEVMSKYKEDLLAIQDMGAAGLTCSTMEMSSKSDVGMRIDLDKVPVREKEMKAYELLLSESQERMLAIVQKGSEEKFKAVMNRWGCEAEVIGETTADACLKMSYQGEQCVNLPIHDVMDPPDLKLELKPYEVPQVQDAGTIPQDLKEEWQVLSYMLSLPRIASKRAVFEQYDSSVGAATVQGPGGEAAMVWLPSEESEFSAAAFKGACDEEWAEWNPNLAARAAIAECVRSLACVGARPLGLTDGVNLGNPGHEAVLPKLEAFIQGMNAGIEIFDAACVSGNVSLFNQTITADGPVDIAPTIFVVMVGRVEDCRKSKPNVFQKAGNEVWLLETTIETPTLPYGSVYARKFWPTEMWRAEWPQVDLRMEKKLQLSLLEAHDLGLFESVRDVADGGLAVAIAEACVGGERLWGFEGDWSKTQKRRDLILFGEQPGRVIVEITPDHRAALMKLARSHELKLSRLGSVTDSEEFRLRPLCQGPVNELKQAWFGCYH